MSENYDLDNIVTPIDANKLDYELRRSGFEDKERQYLVSGFKQGFDIGYQGPKCRQSTAKNLPIRVGSETELWNKIMKEVKAGRVAGPYDQVPYDNYIQSPIGLVPKAGGKTRLIFHLSYDFGDENDDKSLNFHTPDELCSVKYRDLDQAVANCLEAKAKQKDMQDKPMQGNVQFEEQPIYLGKTDVQSAFHLVPLSVFSWAWLIMLAVNPITKKIQYFVDKCLPFGASISCSIFQRFSNALHHIIQFRTNTKKSVINYLDDFLFVSYCINFCNSLIREFLVMCSELGVPIAADKTEWACTRLVFLGILLDGEFMLIAVPEEKHQKAIYLLNRMQSKKKATIRDLQVLCGYLNFLNKAIYPGRAFTRRMYAKYAAHWDKKSSGKKGNKQCNPWKTYKLKPYHHVRLDKEFKIDCSIWLSFLQDSSFTNVVNRPMLDINRYVTSEQISYYSDASAAPELGYGCVYKQRWVYGKWPEGFVKRCDPSIEFLELYALVIGLFTWQEKLANCRIIIFCDNKAVVSMVNNLSSKCKKCMYLIKLLVLNGLQFNRRVSVKYIRSKDNILSDALSCLQLGRFKQEGPHMNQFPDTIHQQVQSVEQLYCKAVQL